MKLYQYMIGIVLVVVILSAFAATYSTQNGLASKYNVTIESSFSEVYQNHTSLRGELDEITGIATNMSDETISTKQIEDDYSDPSKALINVLKMIWDGFDLVKGFILGVGEVLNLPPIITMGAVSLLIISILFAVLSAIFRYEV